MWYSVLIMNRNWGLGLGGQQGEIMFDPSSHYLSLCLFFTLILNSYHYHICCKPCLKFSFVYFVYTFVYCIYILHHQQLYPYSIVQTCEEHCIVKSGASFLSEEKDSYHAFVKNF